MASFSKKESISYGWKTMKRNFRFFVVVLLIMLAVNILPGMLAGALEGKQSNLIGFIIRLAGWILQLVISLGSIGVALRIHDKKKVNYKNLFDYANLVIPYLLASIIYSAIVIVGLILFIIPGIIWSIKFRYFSYFMVDRNMGPIDALKKSSKITEGIKWNLFLLGILLGLINLLGAVALGVGLLVTMPTTMMAEAWVFRRLATK